MEPDPEVREAWDSRIHEASARGRSLNTVGKRIASETAVARDAVLVCPLCDGA
jgi:hypothetical protein